MITSIALSLLVYEVGSNSTIILFTKVANLFRSLSRLYYICGKLEKGVRNEGAKIKYSGDMQPAC